MGEASSLAVTTRGKRVTVAGDVDHRSASVLARHLAARSGDVEVDLSGVTFMDSSGLRVLVQAELVTRGRGDMFAVVAASPVVDRLLALTGLVERLRPSGERSPTNNG